MARSFRSIENVPNRNIAIAAIAAPVKKVAPAPLIVQISPAIELASKAQVLWQEVYKPIAVPVWYSGTRLLIQALEIPSVAAAYKP